MKTPCPACGSQPLYVGISQLICPTPSCQNYRQASPSVISAEGLDSAPPLLAEPARASLSTSMTSVARGRARRLQDRAAAPHVVPFHRNPSDASLEELVDEELRRSDPQETPVFGCLTGLADLDELLGQLEPGELTVLEGPSGVGKSSLIQQVLAYSACHRHPSAFVSLESGVSYVVRRLICGLARIDPARLPHFLTRQELADYRDAAQVVRRLPLRLVAPVTLSPLGLEQLVAGLEEKQSLELLGLDGADSLSEEGLRGRRCAQPMHQLKQLARSRDMSVIVTRAAPPTRGPRRLRPAEEAAPDRVVALELRAPSDSEEPWKWVMRARVLKNRRGPSGEAAEFDFDLRTGRIRGRSTL
jgi:hypothetical protein